MKIQNHLKKLHKFWNQYSILFFALATVACVSLISVNRADALYILTGATDSAIVLDHSADADVVKDFSSQLVYLNGTQSSGYEITLKAGQTVCIQYNNAAITTQAQDETISALLSRLHIEPSSSDVILTDLSGPGVNLTIASDLTYYDQVQEPVAYQTKRVASANLPKDVEKVIQAGVNGTRTAVYQVVYSGGKQVSRQLVEEKNCTTVNEIVAYGTGVSSVSSDDRISSVSKNADGSGVLTFKSGGTMKFSKIKSMTATAYTAGSGGADHYTATGTVVCIGTVAVDKRVIPLGSKLYIVTNDGKVVYGMAVARDTGVRGNVVDLYYNTYQQCINFGRRSCTVYLLNN